MWNRFSYRHFRTAALCVAVLLFVLPTSCRRKGNDMIPNFEDRAKVPGMWLDSVTTLISDSGVIRYRVQTAKWDVLDKAADPYWYFPDKLHFERFNDTLVIESNVDCDTAWYYYNRKLWVLKQNVSILNLSGELFETSLMYWDQDRHRVYSDTAFIRIRQSNQVIVGHGFESNESMTNYTVHEIEGMFPMDKDTTANDVTTIDKGPDIVKGPAKVKDTSTVKGATMDKGAATDRDTSIVFPPVQKRNKPAPAKKMKHSSLMLETNQ